MLHADRSARANHAAWSSEKALTLALALVFALAPT
eukprot:CAMPEP_0119380178 /NCGR_PEP_ID=MMETSP1334-20130426/55870_1 /TAXON_ID=127549 /ORGANISM="Calcidiscus leptoporus, Strain RCC1130" /LENGTH=34 /DNA_ID= /DNA_START= /DNA_END= /DNA_ORIENTATION=